MNVKNVRSKNFCGQRGTNSLVKVRLTFIQQSTKNEHALNLAAFCQVQFGLSQFGFHGCTQCRCLGAQFSIAFVSLGLDFKLIALWYDK